MPRFLLNPCGTAGDVHPYLAVGRELRQRGHEVYLLTNPAFEEAARRHDLQFVPIGEQLDWNELRQDARIQSPRHAWKAAMEWGATGSMRQVFATIKELYLPNATVVASPAWSVGARIARESLGIPLATLVINPFLLRSAYRSPITPQMWMPNWMPRWAKRFQYWFGDTLVIDPLMGKSIAAFRRELGLPDAKRWMNRWWFSPDLVLGLFNERFVPVQPDWPCQVTFVGHTVTDPQGDADINAKVHAFLDAGEPAICFVPGSVGPGSSNYYSAVIEACQKLKLRGLILDNTEQNLDERLPPTLHHARYSPLREALKKCRAIVHSGCMGTTAQGLLAGLPHLVRPRVNDQLDIAERLRQLGVAATIPHRQFNEHSLTQKLSWLLHDPTIRARASEVQVLVATDHATRSIPDHLEKLLPTTAQHQPPHH